MTDQFLNLIAQLQLRLQSPLPGRDAQRALMTEHRLRELEQTQDTAGARESGVLVLLYEKDGQVFFPLIQRPEYDGVHSGQIALPGGKKEPFDTNVTATALREANEEIGVKVTEVQVLGLLSQIYIPPSHFMVNVVLGYADHVPDFEIDPYEVASLINFPLLHLLNENVIENRQVVTSLNSMMTAPGFVFKDYFIWGATAMILNELKNLIKK